MKNTKYLLPCVLASFALVSFLSIERSAETKSYTVGTQSKAEARRAFRAVARAVTRVAAPIARVAQRAVATVKRTATNVVRTVQRTATRVVRTVQRTATRVVRTVQRVATRAVAVVKKGVQTVVKTATKVAKGVVKTVKKVADQVVKGVKGVAELAKKGLKAIGDAVKKGLMALKDLLGWVWNTMKNKLLKPVGDFFKKGIEKAKKALKGLVDKALAGLKGIFMDKVLGPGLEFAFKKLFPNGQKTLDKIKGIAQRVLGKIENVVNQSEAFAETMQAFAEKNLSKYEAGLKKFDGALAKWTTITLADLAGQLVAWAKEKVEDFVRSKTVDLLGKAFKLIETPINVGKTAALAAISSIPFVGGAISGAADIIIQQGLNMLRDKGFEFLGNEAAKLAGKAVDWLGGYVVKGAAAIDGKLKPILDPIMRTIKPWVEKALGMVNTVKSKWMMLREKLTQAKAVLAKAQGVVR